VAHIADVQVLPKPRRKHRKTHGKIGFAELAKAIATNWKNLDVEQREIFERQAAVQKEKYMEAVKMWAATRSTNAASTSTTTNICSSVCNQQQFSPNQASVVTLYDDPEVLLSSSTSNIDNWNDRNTTTDKAQSHSNHKDDFLMHHRPKLSMGNERTRFSLPGSFLSTKMERLVPLQNYNGMQNLNHHYGNSFDVYRGSTSRNSNNYNRHGNSNHMPLSRRLYNNLEHGVSFPSSGTDQLSMKFMTDDDIHYDSSNTTLLEPLGVNNPSYLELLRQDAPFASHRSMARKSTTMIANRCASLHDDKNNRTHFNIRSDHNIWPKQHQPTFIMSSSPPHTVDSYLQRRKFRTPHQYSNATKFQMQQQRQHQEMYAQSFSEVRNDSAEPVLAFEDDDLQLQQERNEDADFDFLNNNTNSLYYDHNESILPDTDVPYYGNL
jgi:HMG (high mobility group) box